MNKKAFTLIELLVVTVIICIMLAMTFPALKKVKERQQGKQVSPSAVKPVGSPISERPDVFTFTVADSMLAQDVKALLQKNGFVVEGMGYSYTINRLR